MRRMDGRALRRLSWWSPAWRHSSADRRGDAARGVRRARRAGPDGATCPTASTSRCAAPGRRCPIRGRAGACTVIIAGKHIFVVDAGEGGARNISLMGIPNGRIEGVFLTHFHSDHIDGLGPDDAAALDRRSARPARCRSTVRPASSSVVAGFDAAYTLDSGYRTAHHGAGHRTAIGRRRHGDALRDSAARVDRPRHRVRDATGCASRRFASITGRSIRRSAIASTIRAGRSWSAATPPRAPALVAAARNADLLIHEGLQPKLVGADDDALTRAGSAGTRARSRATS